MNFYILYLPVFINFVAIVTNNNDSDTNVIIVIKIHRF